MRAVVVHGPQDLRIDELPDPTPGPGEVLVAVEWGGICGSDLSYWRHGGSGTAMLRHPLVLGHEVAGRVAALGDGVHADGAATLAVGRPVTIHPARATDASVLPDRLAGRTNLHSEVRYFGSAALDPHTDGGFCELKAVPAEQVRALPEGVSTRAGSLAEPLAVALHALDLAGDVRGRELLVNGCGPIGSLVVAGARQRGASRVMACDISPAALSLAKAMGADDVYDVGAGTALPADVETVVEASGVPAALQSVLRMTARGGTLVQVGNLPGTPAPAALGDLVTREITWRGSYRFVDLTDALATLADGLDVEPLLTHTFEVDDAQAAMETAAHPDSGKVLLQFGRTATTGSGEAHTTEARRQRATP